MQDSEIEKNGESPEYVKISLAAAMQLGYSPARFYRAARMTCINILLTYSSKCAGNCSYCGLARERQIDEDKRSFIRVPWPTKPFSDVLDRIAKNRAVKRVCISMVTNARSIEDVRILAQQIRSNTDKPISVLAAPTLISKSDLENFRDAGVDRVGVAFDLPTEDLFEANRGKGVNGPHDWNRYWEVFKECVEVFGKGMAGSHFIVGLDETEREMSAALQKVHDMGGVNHLFSFFPEEGSALSDREPPSLDVYRRIQIACELIDSGLSRFENFRFDDQGRVAHFGVEDALIETLIAGGKPFRTRGCSGADGETACNRPFANAFPGKEIRNYPFPPDEEDLADIRRQIEVPR